MNVSPNGLGLITGFEGKPRLKARLCEGGAYEVGYGCTYYPDGRPVGPNDEIIPDMVEPMLMHCMAVELAPLVSALDRKLDQNWLDAFASFAFNVGGHNAARLSDAVKLYNEGRDQEAAGAFVGWISATSAGPTGAEQGDDFYDGVWEKRDGVARWIGPDGTPCQYRRRMRGLLRRRLAEGCVALGYDWRQACANDAVFLRRTREWNAKKAWWEDKVISMTVLKDVLPVARRYPLTARAEREGDPIASQPDPPQPTPAPVAVKAEPLPDIVLRDPLPPPPIPAPEKKPVTQPAPQLPNDFDPSQGAKAMVFSRRFWGWVLIVLGRFSFVTDGTANALSGGAGAVGEFANSIAADPVLLDMYTGVAVMMAGEAVRWWGEKKATKVLK